MIAPNIRLLYDGQSIPTNFQRDSGYDGFFLKGWGNESVGATGGSDTHTHSFTHSHTIVGHSHTFDTNAADADGSILEDDGDQPPSWGSWQSHTHPSGSTTGTSGGTIGGTFTSGSASNNPPYYNFVLIKSTNWNLIPPDACVLRADTNRPELTRHTASDNKYIRIASTAGGTGGSFSHTHSVNHTHSSVSHYHPSRTSTHVGNDGGSGNSSTQASKLDHWHDFNSASTTDQPNSYTGSSTSTTVEPPFVTLVVYKNTSTNNQLPKIGDIALLANETVPIGWVVCDGTNGTPDLRNYFVKHTTSPLTTGGATSHSHSSGASHSHTATTSHTHANVGTGPDDSGDGFITGVGSHTVCNTTHHHTANNWSTTTTSWNSASISLGSTSSQPKYKIIKFIQMKQLAQSSSPFLFMKG